MAALEGQSGTLDLTEPCARCGRAIGALPVASACPSGRATPKFYLFPTRNVFHGTCLATEVMELASPQQCSKIRSIMLRLSRVCLRHLQRFTYILLLLLDCSDMMSVPLWFVCHS